MDRVDRIEALVKDRNYAIYQYFAWSLRDLAPEPEGDRSRLLKRVAKHAIHTMMSDGLVREEDLVVDFHCRKGKGYLLVDGWHDRFGGISVAISTDRKNRYLSKAARRLVGMEDSHRALIYFDEIADDTQLTRTLHVHDRVNGALPDGEDLQVLRLNGSMDGKNWCMLMSRAKRAEA